MIRVFPLDDHEVVRRGLTDLLHAAGDNEVVGESGSAQEAPRRIPALRPDVAVLDAASTPGRDFSPAGWGRAAPAPRRSGDEGDGCQPQEGDPP